MIEFLFGIGSLIVGTIATITVVIIFGLIITFIDEKVEQEDILVLLPIIFWLFVTYIVGKFLLGLL
jgi:hypothetical protein